MVSFNVVLVNVLALILLSIPGFILIKFRIMKDISGGITYILLYICQPILTFVSFQKINYSSGALINIGLAAVFSFLGIGLSIIMNFIIFSKWKKVEKAKVYKYGAVFSNCAFMGIPLIQSVFGVQNPEIIVYATVFITFFNLFSWTAGIYAMTGDIKYISLKKAVLNPPTIAFILSLPLFFINFHLTDYSYFGEKLFDSLEMIAYMITPLSMIIIGMKLAQMNLKDMFLSLGVYFASFIKLIICPIFMLLLLMPFDIDVILKTSLVFSMAMPAAMTTVIFSQTFGGDVKEASALVMLSTLLSLLSIPLIFLLI
jgi:hypothetical protein